MSNPDVGQQKSSSLGNWVLGARPKTLPAAVVPVAVGTASSAVLANRAISEAAVAGETVIIWWRAIAAMIVALALQIATNYANDYSDGVRGTDEGRSGPLRLVGSGAVEAKAVKRAAILWFAIAGFVGLVLSLAAGPELLLVGAASIAAGWFYTGGKNPYGYLGFGELFVFVFFGLVATLGSAYVQPGGINATSWLVAVVSGIFSCALLVTNNLRDIPTDQVSNKKTLAVRLGDSKTRQLFIAMLVVAVVLSLVVSARHIFAVLGLVCVVPCVRAQQVAASKAIGKELIPALVYTSKAQLCWGVGTTVGFAAHLFL